MKLFKNKKGQLGFIELKFFFLGLVLGIIVALVLVYLGTKGIIFKIPVC